MAQHWYLYLAIIWNTYIKYNIFVQFPVTFEFKVIKYNQHISG